jgi:uncharacterized protein (DUF1697 family)
VTSTEHAFALFLRGINVGGVRIAMKDLQRVLTEAGFGSVRTLLASGNAVLRTATPDAAEVKTRTEAALRTAFGYEAWVIVKTPAEVDAILDGYPFEAPDDGTARHAYAILTTGPDVVAAGLAAAEPSPDERFAGSGDVVYWEVPKGRSLDTNLSKVFAKPKFKPLATTRNLNTLRKVRAALAEVAGPA